MSGLYQDRLRTGSWTSRQRACDIPMNRLSADLNLLSGCAVLGLMCLHWCANFVLKTWGSLPREQQRICLMEVAAAARESRVAAMAAMALANGRAGGRAGAGARC